MVARWLEVAVSLMVVASFRAASLIAAYLMAAYLTAASLAAPSFISCYISTLNLPISSSCCIVISSSSFTFLHAAIFCLCMS